MRPLLVRISPIIFVLVVLVMLTAPVSIYAQDEAPPDNCTVTSYHIEGQANGSPVKTKIPPAESLIPNTLFSLGDGEEPTEGDTPVAIIIVDDFTSRLPDTEQTNGNDLIPLTHGEVVEQVILSQISNPAITTAQVNVAGMNFISGDVAQALNARLEEIRAESDYTINTFVVNMSIALIPCNPDEPQELDILNFLIGFRDANASAKVSAFADGLFALRQEEGPTAGLRELLTDDTLLGLLDAPYGVNDILLSEVLPDSRDDLINLLGLDEEATNSDLLEVLSARLGMDPLQLVGPLNNLSGQPNGDMRVVLVASAGNYGPSLPMFPARWPDFVAVSASADGADVDTHLGGSGLLEFPPSFPSDHIFSSNSGEISASGVFPEIVSEGDYQYIGTSISAPYVSADIATRLATGTTCSLHPVDDWEDFNDTGTVDCVPTR